MEKTLFQKIIDREFPAVFVYEDDVCAVFMDKFPAIEGQVLVVPREPVDYYFNLDEATRNHCMSVTQKVVAALDKAFNTTRTCMIIEGFEIPHAHIKLYPTTDNRLDMKKGEMMEDEKLEELAGEIKKHLE